MAKTKFGWIILDEAQAAARGYYAGCRVTPNREPGVGVVFELKSRDGVAILEDAEQLAKFDRRQLDAAIEALPTAVAVEEAAKRVQDAGDVLDTLEGRLADADAAAGDVSLCSDPDGAAKLVQLDAHVGAARKLVDRQRLLLDDLESKLKEAVRAHVAASDGLLRQHLDAHQQALVASAAEARARLVALLGPAAEALAIAEAAVNVTRFKEGMGLLDQKPVAVPA